MGPLEGWGVGMGWEGPHLVLSKEPAEEQLLDAHRRVVEALAPELDLRFVVALREGLVRRGLADEGARRRLL